MYPKGFIFFFFHGYLLGNIDLRLFKQSNGGGGEEKDEKWAGKKSGKKKKKKRIDRKRKET